ncbi:MAG: response regulator transcription factor [Ferruginibacter sp.]
MYLLPIDHFLVRKGIKELLSDHYPSISFDEAADTSTLLEKAMASEWDLVISDINMPGEGGLYALTAIRHRYPSLPILMLSIHSEQQYALRVIKSGASGFLNKIAVGEEMIKVVGQLLSGKKYFSQAVIELLALHVGAGTTKQTHESLSNRGV